MRRFAPVLALPLALLPALLSVQTAAAHNGAPLAPHDLWTAWTLEPGPLFLIAALGLVYTRAVANLWTAAGAGHGLARWRVGAFGGGLALLGLALLSPLDALAAALFSAHMVQHVLLMMAAAPLLVLGAPAHIWLWALPLGGRRALARWWHKQAGLRRVLRPLPWPWLAWLLSALALWLWHLPTLYEAALADERIHGLEHALLLGAAWLFWEQVFQPQRRSLFAEGTAILLLFTTALHSGILGALITFAHAPWYGSYAATTAAWDLTPLADQQLAGVIMWAPAGLVYLAAMLALLGLRLAQWDQPRGITRRIGSESP